MYCNLIYYNLYIDMENKMMYLYIDIESKMINWIRFSDLTLMSQFYKAF